MDDFIKILREKTGKYKDVDDQKLKELIIEVLRFQLEERIDLLLEPELEPIADPVDVNFTQPIIIRHNSTFRLTTENLKNKDLLRFFNGDEFLFYVAKQHKVGDIIYDENGRQITITSATAFKYTNLVNAEPLKITKIITHVF